MAIVARALKPFDPAASKSPTWPAGALRLVTKADDDLPDGTCRALLVGTAGTANIVDASGETLADVPLQQGYNPISCQQVRTGGDADDIWAIYDV